MKSVEPYNGDKPFIFVSYAHKDSDLVWPVINRMIEDGYRVWYDDGIDPGTEWDEFIASRIRKCGYFLAFISENYIVSDNCKDELNYARDKVSDRLLVYLDDDVSLPDGMEMRLGRIQAIYRLKFKSDEHFIRKLYNAKNLYLFNDNDSYSPEPAEITKTSEVKGSRLRITPELMKEIRRSILIAFLVGMVLVGVALYKYYWAPNAYPNFCPHNKILEADCTHPKTCLRCGTTTGEPLPHNFVELICTNCDYSETITDFNLLANFLEFSYSGAGFSYESDEEGHLAIHTNITSFAKTRTVSSVYFIVVFYDKDGNELSDNDGHNCNSCISRQVLGYNETNEYISVFSEGVWDIDSIARASIVHVQVTYTDGTQIAYYSPQYIDRF